MTTVGRVQAQGPFQILDQLCPDSPSLTSHFTIEVKTIECIVAIGDPSEAGSGRFHLDIKGNWLGASCAGIDEWKYHSIHSLCELTS